MGSIAAVFASAESLRLQMARVTGPALDGPFESYHVIPLLNEEAFAATLEAKPAVISFALGDPGEIRRA